MGNYNTKDTNNVAMAQAQVTASHNNVEDKLNTFGIILLVIVVLLLIVILYGIKRHCRTKMRNWLRKQVVQVSPPIQVQTVHQQPPATNCV